MICVLRLRPAKRRKTLFAAATRRKGAKPYLRQQDANYPYRVPICGSLTVTGKRQAAESKPPASLSLPVTK